MKQRRRVKKRQGNPTRLNPGENDKLRHLLGFPATAGGADVVEGDGASAEED
jgi:hypothetical protein